MKIIPKWIKWNWQDPAFKFFTFALPTTGLLWDFIITQIDGKLHYWTSVLMFGICAIMYIIGYVKYSRR